MISNLDTHFIHIQIRSETLTFEFHRKLITCFHTLCQIMVQNSDTLHSKAI